jgi:hypothetical protein
MHNTILQTNNKTINININKIKVRVTRNRTGKIEVKIMAEKQSIRKTLIKDIPLKSGIVLKKGSIAEVRSLVPDSLQSCQVTINNESYRLRYTSVFKSPSMNQLEKWTYDDIVKTPAGSKVEPDGYDQYNFPSWLLVLGMI